MTQTSPSKSRECIVLVHGLAASTHFLRTLEKHCARLGFQVHNWGYPSVGDGRFLSLPAIAMTSEVSQPSSQKTDIAKNG